MPAASSRTWSVSGSPPASRLNLASGEKRGWLDWGRFVRWRCGRREWGDWVRLVGAGIGISSVACWDEEQDRAGGEEIQGTNAPTVEFLAIDPVVCLLPQHWKLNDWRLNSLAI